MNFDVDDMRDMLCGNSERYVKIWDTLVGTSRWSIHHEVTFNDNSTGKLYKIGYHVGATEYQDEDPWEGEHSVECDEV